MQGEEDTLDAKWQTVQDELEKRLEPLGLRMHHDCWFRRNENAQPHYAVVEIRERSQLTVGLLLACHAALANVVKHLGLIVGMYDDQGVPESLVEISGGGFTTIEAGTQPVVRETYRAIGIVVD